jgi:O-antigen biosynthesis protein
MGSTVRHQFLAPSRRYEQIGPVDRYARNRLLLEWVGDAKRVLELGCSTGYMSRLLVKQQCRVVGVERDADAARSARDVCERVLVVDLNDADWAGDVEGHFDVILMGDVLEHLVHPDQLLRRVTDLLNPGGYLVISLPNVVHWRTRFNILFGNFDYQSEGTLDCTHLRFFNLHSARALIENAGFQIKRFHPAIGGRGSDHVRAVLQCLANVLPGLFAYQLLFQAAPT